MSESNKSIKTVKGPKAAVATFISKKNGVRIYVFQKKTESKESAIQRVMSKHSSQGATYELCN
jgi:hypothetical protein